MGQTKARKLRQLSKQLDPDDVERLVEIGERLKNKGAVSKSSGEESLVDDNQPSYRALADPFDYEHTKREIEEGRISADLI